MPAEMANKLIGFVVKGVGSSIGLVSESVHHYKDKKRSKSESELQASSEATLDQPEEEEHNDEAPAQQENDEEQWQLDEAQEEVANTASVVSLKGGGEEEDPQTQIIQQSKSYNKYNPKILFKDSSSAIPSQPSPPAPNYPTLS